MVETGLNGLHRLNTIKILSICHELLGKSGIKEEMKECKNIKKIINRFSKKLDIQNKLDFNIYT